MAARTPAELLAHAEGYAAERVRQERDQLRILVGLIGGDLAQAATSLRVGDTHGALAIIDDTHRAVLERIETFTAAPEPAPLPEGVADLHAERARRKGRAA